MTEFVIGKNAKSSAAVRINLERLIETRMLVTANSGGGKSWLLRKILEETHGKVQQIVLDLEGEFSSLREKYDYLLVGKDGDIPISVKAAELLAKKILELNASTIIDLYELKHQDRIHFVKLFLDSMINAPKELWHPCLVIVDEAHIFAPEKGESEAMSSVIDLCTRGRKRGFCGILASQRLSKLHKDAAAECLPKGELVSCKCGLIPIEQVRVDDFVYTHDGTFCRVTKVFSRDYLGVLYKIRTRGNNLETRVTPEHPILVSKRKLFWKGNTVIRRSFSEPVWKAADNLSKNDYVLFPVFTKIEDAQKITVPFTWEHRLRNKVIQIRERTLSAPVGPELMKIAGYYLSEGSTGKNFDRNNSYHVEFSFGKGEKEKKYADELINSLVIIGLRGTLYLKQGYWHVQCASSALAKWLIEDFGSGASNKSIPLWIKKLPPEKISVLLEAYINGDGHRALNHSEGRTVSRQLAYDLRDIALKLGLVSTILSYSPKPGNKIRGRTVKQKRFYITQFSKGNKKGSVLRDEKNIYLKIKKIEKEHYEGKVYNLEVEKNNSFCTHSHAVHNCNNKIIGRASLDIDMKRSAEELGFTTREDTRSLRDLEPGEFYAFGSAISKTVEKIKVGAVKTSHPRLGTRLGGKQPTPAPAKIRALIKKLSDLPKEAEEETTDRAALRRRVRELEFQLRSKPIPASAKPIIDEKALARAQASGYEKAKRENAQEITVLSKRFDSLRIKILDLASLVDGIPKNTPADIAARFRAETVRQAKPLMGGNGVTRQHAAPAETRFKSEPPKIPASQREPDLAYAEGKLRSGAMRILKAVVSFHPTQVSVNQAAVLAGFTARGGTFQTYLSELKRAGWLKAHGNFLEATSEGIEAAGDVEVLPSTPEALVDLWASKFRKGCASLLKAIAACYPNPISKQELGEETNFTISGGTFQTYLSELRAAGLIEVSGEEVTATKELFLE